MAARIFAQVLVLGSGVVVRAVSQAYRQAISNATKNGVTQEAVQTVRKSIKTLNAAEARQILGVSEKASWQDILQKYNKLFESNAKNGSFYLQSKVHRAKECLETIEQAKVSAANL